MNNEIKCGIYKITSPSERIYIGESKDIRKRWSNYRLLRCKAQPKIYHSLLKYGFEQHLFEIIEECVFEKLKERERYWQDYYDVLNGGLNLQLTKHGELKQIASAETRLKISIKGKSRRLTEEHKKNLRKPKSEQGRENIANAIRLRTCPFLGNDNSFKKKVLLNTETGIFYLGCKDAAESINMSYYCFSDRMKGKTKNNTSFIYV